MKYYQYAEIIDHTYIYDISIDEFLTHLPPCKECLVQPICMNVYDYIANGKEYPKLIINACKELDKFMKGKKYFRKL